MRLVARLKKGGAALLARLVYISHSARYKTVELSSRTIAILIALLVAAVLTTFAYVMPGLPVRQAFLAGGVTGLFGF